MESSGRIARALVPRRTTLARAVVLTLALTFACAPLLPSLALAAHAAPPATSHAAQTVRAASTGHVTAIVLDMSGSMAQNDPAGLRCSAANAYIDLSGPGDFIGVVGLDNAGATGGPQNFGPAQVWAQPAEMSTVAARTALRNTIAAKSHNCQPDSSTPTYDALNQALKMLTNATAGNTHTGSVILLTDGVPEPNPNDQIAAIKNDLVPQFKSHGFQVDTVALGSDQTLHGFLGDVANATSGKFYDDGKGVVSGVSPLNIAPFFVDIFARRNGRVVAHDIPPTQANGGTVSRNFSVGDFVSHLDVVAVKDSPAMSITLTAPNGRRLPPTVAGTFISTDPHYAIFSIDHPQTGAWQLNVSGSGQFLMDSLKVTTLGLSIVSPDTKASAVPIGQPMTIAATLNDNGTPITGRRYSLSGSISYSGGDKQYAQEFVLDDGATPGTYSAKITVPENGPTGAYDISVVAREVSDTIASATRSVRVELFPVPMLLSPATGKPTTDTVPGTVVRWDPLLTALYSIPIGLVWQLGQWALGGHPAQPSASLAGQVYLKSQPYANATVTGTASPQGSHATVPITVSNDGGGRFHVFFPSSANGLYTVTFDTQGAFQDSHGDFGTVTRTARLTVTPASFGQELVAWLYTIVYLLLFAALLNLIRTLVLTPAPFGSWERSTSAQGKTARAQAFRRTLRSPLAWFLHRNVLTSRETFKTPGLQFRFKRGGLIEARTVGPEGRRWSSGAGRLSDQYAAHRVLIYRPGGGGERHGLDGESDGVTYTISADARQPRGGRGAPRGRSSNPARSKTSTRTSRTSRTSRSTGSRSPTRARSGSSSRGGGNDSLFGGI
ncbi:MAG: vWA domain-containing protein [Ktedonobacterales bacterium]